MSQKEAMPLHLACRRTGEVAPSPLVAMPLHLACRRTGEVAPSPLVGVGWDQTGRFPLDTPVWAFNAGPRTPSAEWLDPIRPPSPTLPREGGGRKEERPSALMQRHCRKRGGSGRGDEVPPCLYRIPGQ